MNFKQYIMCVRDAYTHAHNIECHLINCMYMRQLEDLKHCVHRVSGPLHITVCCPCVTYRLFMMYIIVKI